MPVIAATRAVRRSCSARWPDTPASRWATDTARATAHERATRTALTSRTGLSSSRKPSHAAPAASSPYTPRNNQP